MKRIDEKENVWIDHLPIWFEENEEKAELFVGNLIPFEVYQFRVKWNPSEHFGAEIFSAESLEVHMKPFGESSAPIIKSVKVVRIQKFTVVSDKLDHYF